MPRPRNTPGLSCWSAFDAFPPIFVRLAARHGAGGGTTALSHQEIAITTGIPLSRVIEISESFTFDILSVGEARAFCRACNFDPTSAADRERQRDYIRRSCHHQMKHRPPRPLRPPAFLRNSPHWETQFLPLIRLLKSRQSSSAESTSSASPERKYGA